MCSCDHNSTMKSCTLHKPSIDGKVAIKKVACHNQGALTYWLEQWNCCGFQH